MEHLKEQVKKLKPLEKRGLKPGLLAINAASVVLPSEIPSLPKVAEPIGNCVELIAQPSATSLPVGFACAMGFLGTAFYVKSSDNLALQLTGLIMLAAAIYLLANKAEIGLINAVYQIVGLFKTAGDKCYQLGEKIAIGIGRGVERGIGPAIKVNLPVKVEVTSPVNVDVHDNTAKAGLF